MKSFIRSYLEENDIFFLGDLKKADPNYRQREIYTAKVNFIPAKEISIVNIKEEGNYLICFSWGIQASGLSLFEFDEIGYYELSIKSLRNPKNPRKIELYNYSIELAVENEDYEVAGFIKSLQEKQRTKEKRFFTTKNIKKNIEQLISEIS